MMDHVQGSCIVVWLYSPPRVRSKNTTGFEIPVAALSVILVGCSEAKMSGHAKLLRDLVVDSIVAIASTNNMEVYL